MTKIQQAITQDDRKVNAKVISSISKPLKECRKKVAVYSAKQVCKKHFEDLRYSTSIVAQKARLVPKYFEACFNLCWLMAVQDPPMCFGPDVRQGDVFDTDLYEAYTKSGNTVAYVVWPALLLHKGGAVLYKGVAQGKEDHSQRTKCAPNLYERHLNSDETDDLFSSPDRNHKVYKDDKTSYDIDRLYSTKATDHHRISGTDNDYDWRIDNSPPHGHDTSDYSLSDLNNASQYKTYTQGYDKYKQPYNDYQASISHHETKVRPGTSSRYRSKTVYTQKTVTPRYAWR
ncbi:uncharacterized protein LOC132739174 [Ruditapes philippinarum]|uniref:uncharacterized protein LOC132739174 n=1 Tax=Ruditapes philippinarum TaxID=129788 RepID=UPI00295BE6FE|nr:uncharacterized protein LOC132739174 [Ruditapes philippinarum]